MESLKLLRKVFSPMQPSVQGSEGLVTYQEYSPSFLLRPYIYCYWQLRTSQTLTEPFQYRVVSDGCIDILFEADDPSENFIMGLTTTYTTFPLANAFNYIGIRFLPTVFSQFFNVNASTLSNNLLKLDKIEPNVSSFIGEKIKISDTLQDIIIKLNHFFEKQVSVAKFNNDSRFYEALNLIMKNQGCMTIQKLNTGVSPRQLRRLFKYYIGDSPKAFSKIVRFQHVLKSKPSIQSLRNNKLFYDAGYYDQAHFIRDFKTLYGLTPKQAFGANST